MKNKKICCGTVNKWINGVKMWINKMISNVISKVIKEIEVINKVKMIINI